MDIDSEEVSTIGGLVTSELGRIPEVGESVDLHGLHIEITAVEETRVGEVRIRLASPPEEETGEEEAMD